MASCTAVRVRERGRFWVWLVRLRLLRFGRGRMRREATIRTWRSENFFSSSRVRLAAALDVVYDISCEKTYRCWERCQPWRSGTGTKITIALRPWPTSICKNPGVSEKLPSAHRVFKFDRVWYMSPSICSTFQSFFHSTLALLILPRGPRRIAAGAERPSCRGCCSRAHRGQWRSAAPSHWAFGARGCWARSGRKCCVRSM